MVTEKILGHKATDEEIRELFFIDYSEKMWGMPFAELPDRITSRVPKRRANADCGYFDSRQYQGLPSGGYNAMFTAMAAYATEDVRLLAADDDFIKEKADLYVCTGPIDAFFDYAFGALPYRTLDFVKVWTDENLPVAVVNECNKRPYTRTTDYSWFSLITDSTTVMNNHSTVWVREYPRAYEPGETKSFPFYPMPFTEEVQNRYNRYLELSKSANMLFCGRLGTYTYMDMDKTILDVMRTVSSTLR
jgi:UDP-galactopyranose mutase